MEERAKRNLVKKETRQGREETEWRGNKHTMLLLFYLHTQLLIHRCFTQYFAFAVDQRL